MRILGVCGSPHSSGLCARLLKEALKGGKEDGAEFDLVLLAEKNIKPCIDCEESSCWEKMKCTIDDDGIELRKMMNECDALIFSAPVFFLSVNGLAKDFMDRMRYYGESGKPALAIAVAGGTGKGCITALQEICRWLVILGFRSVDPLPVTRYDFDIALVEAKERGKRIIKQKYRPFSSLAEKIAWYEFLPYMKWGMTEEIRYLARVAIDGIVRRGKPDLAAEPREKLEKGETLISIGKWNEGLRLVVEAQEGSMNTFDSLV